MSGAVPTVTRRSPTSKRTSARKSGKEAFLALAGAWKDDPDIEEIVREAHRRRGRPIAENE